MWITMCITLFRRHLDVDNFVENYTTYPQEKNEYVENLVIHRLSTRYPHPPVDISATLSVGLN